jgi:hypothetical protein
MKKLFTQDRGFENRIDTLTVGLGKVRARFVKDATTGIRQARSLRLSKIGEALNEKIALHATHKRLSRNLADDRIGQIVMERILARGAETITEDTRIVLDQFQIEKRFATKMEFIEDIDAEDSHCMGYRMCEAISSNIGSDTYRPLTFALWSRNAPGYQSDAHEIISLIKNVQKVAANKGTFILNAKLGDDDDVLGFLSTGSITNFITRLHDERQLMYRQHTQPASELVQERDLPYSCSAFKYNDDREKQYCLQYGFVPVRLPQAPDRPLSLVVVRCDSYEADSRGTVFYYLLTSLPMRRNQRVLRRVVEAYLTRRQVIASNRLVHQKSSLDDLRVLTFGRVKNLAALMLATHASHIDDVRGLPLAQRGLTFNRRYHAPPTIKKSLKKKAVKPSAVNGLSFPNVDSIPSPGY